MATTKSEIETIIIKGYNQLYGYLDETVLGDDYKNVVFLELERSEISSSFYNLFKKLIETVNNNISSIKRIILFSPNDLKESQNGLDYLTHLLIQYHEMGIKVFPNPLLFFYLESKLYYYQILDDHPEWLVPTWMSVISPQDQVVLQNAKTSEEITESKLYPSLETFSRDKGDDKRGLDVVLKLGYSGANNGFSKHAVSIRSQNHLVSLLIGIANFKRDTFFSSCQEDSDIDSIIYPYLPALVQYNLKCFGDSKNRHDLEVSFTDISATSQHIYKVNRNKHIKADNEYRFLYVNGINKYMTVAGIIGTSKSFFLIDLDKAIPKYIDEAKKFSQEVYDYYIKNILKGDNNGIIIRIDVGFCKVQENKFKFFLNEIDICPGDASIDQYNSEYELPLYSHGGILEYFKKIITEPPKKDINLDEELSLLPILSEEKVIEKVIEKGIEKVIEKVIEKGIKINSSSNIFFENPDYIYTGNIGDWDAYLAGVSKQIYADKNKLWEIVVNKYIPESFTKESLIKDNLNHVDEFKDLRGGKKSRKSKGTQKKKRKKRNKKTRRTRIFNRK